MDFKELEPKIGSLYPNRVSQILEGLQAMVRKYAVADKGTFKPFTHKDVILITYGDSFFREGVAPLQCLWEFATQYLDNLVSALHLLPCFPYSSDDGFSVIDYYSINPELGDWSHIGKLDRSYDLMFDAVVNHVSQKSAWFQAYLEDGHSYADYFIEEVPGADYSKVVRPRALPLFHEYMAGGNPARVWTTFSKDQVDLNYRNPEVFLQVLDVLLFYISKGARYIRLDAIAFIWKEPGTSCIHLEEAHTVIQLYRSIIDYVAPSTILITETNVPHKENISYFGNGRNEAHMVYNFTLPPLLALSVHLEDVSALCHWAKGLELPSDDVCFFNFTASHDGVGVRPLQGVVPKKEIEYLAEITRKHGGFVSMKDNGDGTESPYELNCNYMDLVTDSKEPQSLRTQRFLLTQSVMLTFPGIPGIYYHSIIGSENDREAVQESGINRRINREKLDYDVLQRELADAKSLRVAVYKQYKRLLEVRSGEAVFHPLGEAKFHQDGPVFIIERNHAGERIYAVHNFSHESVTVQARQGKVYDLVNGARMESNEWQVPPFGFQWLKQE